MSTDKEDTGIIQTDYRFNGTTQKLHYRKTSSGVFIYGSSSAASMTNQIETVIKFLVSKKIMDENYTSTGKCLYYRHSEARWDQVSFHRNKETGVFFVDWINADSLSDKEMADLIEKTIAKPRTRFPLRRNHVSCVVGW